jgi:hypothetical protein
MLVFRLIRDCPLIIYCAQYITHVVHAVELVNFLSRLTVKYKIVNIRSHIFSQGPKSFNSITMATVITTDTFANIPQGPKSFNIKWSLTNQPTYRPIHRPTDRPTHRPTAPPTDPSTDRLTLRPTDRPINRPNNRPTHRPINRPTSPRAVSGVDAMTKIRSER